MARFSALDPRLDPYREADNHERVRRLTVARRRLTGSDRDPGLSIIVLNKDRPDLLERCLAGLGLETGLSL